VVNAALPKRLGRWHGTRPSFAGPYSLNRLVHNSGNSFGLNCCCLSTYSPPLTTDDVKRRAELSGADRAAEERGR
jgi:hypothetical protein